MKWTPEVIERLRELADAGKTGKQIAATLGAPVHSTRVNASKAGIKISRSTYETSDERTAALWKDLIGPMKQRLRDDILRAEA